MNKAQSLTNTRSIQAINFTKVLSVSPGEKAVINGYSVPHDKKFVCGVAGWKFFSGQGQEDITIQFNVGTRVIIESAKSETGKRWPPFPDVLRRTVDNTSDPTVGKNYDRVSSTASNSVVDNWLVTANAASFGWPSDKCTFTVENKSEHYTHNVCLFFSGTECDEIDSIRGLPISFDMPRESWNQSEVNVASQRFTLVAEGTKVFGPMPVLGLTHLKFLAYAEDEDMTILLEQGIDDRAATLLYRDSVTYNIPSGNSFDDEVKINGKFIRITVTNDSAVNPNDVELNMQMRKFY